MTNDLKVPDDGHWHSRVVSEVVTRLKSDTEIGLDPDEASIRLARFGPNQITAARRWTRARRVLGQFKDVLIWLLLVTAAVSGLVLDAWVDAAAIAAIVVLNAIIGYAQESRAQSALERLRDLEAPDAVVVRGGLITQVLARDLVPGDILVIEDGDRLPADARLVQSIHLSIDEAALTGESAPVAKSTEPSPDDVAVADRHSMLFAGTSVLAGRGRAMVTGTGLDTEMGRIASLFTDEQPPTPLQVELGRIGRRLAIIAIGAAVLIFAAGLLRSFPVETMALTAVALAVAAIPEGLPAVITVSLAGGLQRLARQNAVVRRLPAVEALGAVDVICTDKTGTLTSPELEVADFHLADGRHGLELLSSGDPPATWAVRAAVLCNNAYRSADGGWDGDPTDVAIVVAAENNGVDAGGLARELPRLDEVAFDGRRKRMSTIHSLDDRFAILTKGAPEVVLARSSRMAGEDGPVPLHPGERDRLLGLATTLAKSGMRLLALASKEFDDSPDDPAEAEADLTFLGLLSLREKIRPEVPLAVRRAAGAGVTTVMVTGDHASTAQAVAELIGLDEGTLVEGRELAGMSVSTLSETIRDHRVFARVDPVDKVKIIEAWQSAGARVAMTGDGVNDAPALHRADIGVAMGSGTDVAREAAAVVLTDDNYATIVAAIAEGRRLFGNLRNVVHYLLSANASEVLFVLVGFLVFGSLGEPLLAIQLLWINLISDSFPAIALGMDKPSRDHMRDPPGRGRDVLSSSNILLLLAQGTILASAAVATQMVGAFLLEHDRATVQTMVFTTLVFAQLLHALSVRARPASTGDGRWSPPGRTMVGALLGSTLLQVAVVYTSIGNDVFATRPLDAGPMIWVVALSLASMVAVRIFNRLVTPPD